MSKGRASDADLPDIAFLLLASFTAFAFVTVLSSAFADGDTGWHIATGQWIATHGTVPRSDPFSFTARGHPWVAHEWLSELLMYGAWRFGGWSGLILLLVPRRRPSTPSSRSICGAGSDPARRR